MKSRRFFLAVLAVIALLLAGPSIRRHVEAVNCGNQMLAINLAACSLWADEHRGYLPDDFLSLSNSIMTPRILVCPADYQRTRAVDWASFTTNNCSYEIVTPGVQAGDTNHVFFRCKIHGFTAYADGTVFDGNRKLTKRLW